MAAREHDLTVAVAAALPFHVARRGLDAREDGLVEPVDESLVEHRAGEPVLHPRISPDLADAEGVLPLRVISISAAPIP